eukprot:UN13555
MDPIIQIFVITILGGYVFYLAFFSYRNVQGNSYMHIIDVLKEGEGVKEGFGGLHLSKQSAIYECWKEAWKHYNNTVMLALGERLYAKMGISSRQAWDNSFIEGGNEETKYVKKYHANVPMHVRSKLFVT